MNAALFASLFPENQMCQYILGALAMKILSGLGSLRPSVDFEIVTSNPATFIHLAVTIVVVNFELQTEVEVFQHVQM